VTRCPDFLRESWFQWVANEECRLSSVLALIFGFIWRPNALKGFRSLAGLLEAKRG
jgi:hypothetical protein